MCEVRTDIAIRFLGPMARKPKGRARKLFSYFGFPVIATGRNTPQARHRVDADVLAYRLLHDDDGSAWRRCFAVSGQGVALSAPFLKPRAS